MAEASFGEANLQWPRSGIKGTLDVGETSVVAVLTKIKPETPNFVEGRSEIEKLNISLDWKLNEKKMKQIASQQQATMNASALRTAVKPTPGSVRFDENVKHADTAGATVYSAPTGSGNTGSQEVQSATVATGDDFSYNPADFGGYQESGANASEKNCAVCTVLNPVSASVCYLCNNTFTN